MNRSPVGMGEAGREGVRYQCAKVEVVMTASGSGAAIALAGSTSQPPPRSEPRRAGIGAGSETGRRITDRGERSSSSERGAERGPASQSVAALPGWAHLSVAYECRAGKVGLLGLISMGQAILGCGLPLMMGCFPSSIFFVAGDRTGQDRATSRSVLEEEKHSILFFPFSFVKLADDK
jgi:hypothetical protein